MADVNDYLGLVTSEHNKQPRYMQTVSLSVQGSVDNINLLLAMPALFDIDTAVGDQLDKVGQWVGLTRYLEVPLQGVYFSWAPYPIAPSQVLDFPGWGQGPWADAAPTSGLTRLDDFHYRILLKARVVANNWDGTKPGAVTAWNDLFAPEGYELFIQDGLPNAIPYFGWGGGPPQEFRHFVWGSENLGWDEGFWGPIESFTWGKLGAGWDEADWFDASTEATAPRYVVGWGMADWFDEALTPHYRDSGDMTIDLGLIAPQSVQVVDSVTAALFTGGELGLQGAGVAVRYYAIQSLIGVPMFGWGAGPPPSELSYLTWGDEDADGWGSYWIGTPPPPPPPNPQAPPTAMSGWGNSAWPLLTPGS